MICRISETRELQLYNSRLGKLGNVSFLRTRCHFFEHCRRTHRPAHQLFGGARCQTRRLPPHRFQSGSARCRQSRRHRQWPRPKNYWYLLQIWNNKRNQGNIIYTPLPRALLRRIYRMLWIPYHFWLSMIDRSWSSLPVVFLEQHRSATGHVGCRVRGCDPY